MSGGSGLHRTLFRISLAVMLQYRVASVVWMIGAILDPLIFLVVWSTAARSSGGRVGDMDPHDVAAYYIVLMLVSHLTFSWIHEVFQYRVQFGSLTFELLRPVHPIRADIAVPLNPRHDDDPIAFYVSIGQAF